MPGSAKFTGKISAALENGAHVSIVIYPFGQLLCFCSVQIGLHHKAILPEMKNSKKIMKVSYLLISRSIRGL